MNDLEVFPPARQWPDLPPQPPKAQQRQLSSPRPAILFTFFQLFRGSFFCKTRFLFVFCLFRASKLLTCILYIYTVSTYRRCIIYTYICYFSRTVLNVVFGNHLQFLCDYWHDQTWYSQNIEYMIDALTASMVAFDACEPAGSSKNMNMEAVMLCHSETMMLCVHLYSERAALYDSCCHFGDSFAIWRLHLV